MSRVRLNPMRELTSAQRQLHTVPARRAVQLKVARRKVAEIVAERSLLTPDQLSELAAAIAAEAIVRRSSHA